MFNNSGNRYNLYGIKLLENGSEKKFKYKIVSPEQKSGSVSGHLIVENQILTIQTEYDYNWTKNDVILIGKERYRYVLQSTTTGVDEKEQGFLFEPSHKIFTLYLHK